jgi:hypothetical protein
MNETYANNQQNQLRGSEGTKCVCAAHVTNPGSQILSYLKSDLYPTLTHVR